MMWGKLGAALLLVGVLSACQSMAPMVGAWQSGTRENLQFATSGRLAVKQNDKGSYANFDWQSNGQVQQLSVNTPLGNTVGQLCQDALGVVAQASNGETFQAASASELSERLMGFAIPVQSLDFWAHGYWDARETHAIDAQGRLLQSGWRIERQVDANGAPRMLLLNNAQLSIRLLFTDYEASAQELTQSACERETN